MNENLSYWPLVVGVYRDAMDLDGYRKQLDAWEHWFAREERFALLRVYTTSASLSHPDGSAPLSKGWLQRHRAALQRSVMGMATVILPPEDYARMKNFQVEKAFGVPGGVFATVDDALTWLREQVFVPAGIASTMPSSGDLV